MKKRYHVALWTKKRFYNWSTNNIGLARFISNFNFWTVAKITDRETYNIAFYKKES